MWQILDWRQTMRNTLAKTNKMQAAVGVLCLISLGGMEINVAAQDTQAARAEKQAMTTQSGFYCNIKALSASERARHKELTEKLMSSRTDTVETEKGYEFQYSPAKVSVAEVAEWVVRESKCCPFFDFHIDLENEGQLVCLRLTGREGIKAFIRLEFSL
ncbi:MAG TPA: hypothetical protein VOA78_07860 [Candidatus Dormibacteraeota bacterium]|nr:hypothetical protein [Candidatus Dormibacteraeota bacterium]